MSARFPGPAAGSPGAPAPLPPGPPARYAAAPPPTPPNAPRPYPGPNFPQQRGGFSSAPLPALGARGPAPGGYAQPPPRPAPPAKRPPDARSPMPPQLNKQMYPSGDGYLPGGAAAKRKKRLADKVLPQKVRDLVPESQAYMDLLAFERKLDATIMRKRLDIQEALKRPMKQKRKLRIFISNTFYPGQGDNAVASWELRVEGRLLDDSKNDPNKVKRKFSSFFKSLVIELDKELYGPDNHLVEWHRTHTTQETDGFQVKRPGYKNVRCTILLLLDYQPLQLKLDARLARLLGVHTQTRPVVVNALWHYARTHRLQDPREREYLVCDKYLEQIFGCSRMKLAEIPGRLSSLLHAPDPIVINHVIGVEAPHDAKQTACYDIDVEVDDSLKAQMNAFLMNTSNQQEIMQLDTKIHDTVDTINQLKTSREFFLSFSKDPQLFTQKWLVSQSRDLKTMTGEGSSTAAGGEGGRRAEWWGGAWCGEGVSRYLSSRAAARRRDLDLAARPALTRL
ncbi:SWI SNF- matrix-associated actin-dependent regulator of chromatin sub D [Plutella xylostella]|uniref:SWI SNF- matrix-associated actin-dependent regulator of chromatin sub D n=1 Tax=Plutella xylostella TaxID=51655 RepID=A0ABQ7QQP7_PLUXY|nr:brahma-associated protein of 60 kDa isoform X1 [Plutella xylostella]KAG7307326.1 SWI SNF- matrix-associated actin-dependent regulator of chromatin sub D [Plutella xylostella]